MSALLARRDLLRGLPALPLFGGSVTLIGQPSAVAGPVTDDLMTDYLLFLAREVRATLIECCERRARRAYETARSEGVDLGPAFVSDAGRKAEEQFRWLDFAFAKERGAPTVLGPPSARAALVLAAVGTDRSGGVR